MKDRVIKLDLSKDIFSEVIKLAGWHEKRKVSADSNISFCEKNNYPINKSAISFWESFYGIKDRWYFKWLDMGGKNHIGGYDFCFDADIASFLKYHFTDHGDREDELRQIPRNKRSLVTPLCEAGFHDPGILWIDDTGKIYFTLYFDEEEAEVYDSVFDYLEKEMSVLANSSVSLWLTFSSPSDLE